MPSLRQQIRAYFESQALSPTRAEAILRAGRQAAEGLEPAPIRPLRRWPSVLALAAAVLIFAGLVFVVIPPHPAPVAFAALPPRVIEFFAGAPELPLQSQDHAALRAWHLRHGAPPEFAIPAQLAGLESYGCSVVDVQGRPAYLTCFWQKREGDRNASGLIHLLAVKRSDFREAPTGAERVTREIEGWSFVSWSDGPMIYTLAALAPLETVRGFADRRARGVVLPVAVGLSF